MATTTTTTTATDTNDATTTPTTVKLRQLSKDLLENDAELLQLVHKTASKVANPVLYNSLNPTSMLAIAILTKQYARYCVRQVMANILDPEPVYNSASSDEEDSGSESGEEDEEDDEAEKDEQSAKD